MGYFNATLVPNKKHGNKQKHTALGLKTQMTNILVFSCFCVHDLGFWIWCFRISINILKS